MAGNVLEWCLDAYREDFYAECHRQGPLTDPVGQGDGGSSRVLRGGAFDHGAGVLRSSDRDRYGPGGRNQGVGFRCVLAARRQP